MQNINRIEKNLFIEKVSLTELALKYGTPLYVYSSKTIEENYLQYINNSKNTYKSIKDILVCFSVKSNSNIAILNLLSKLGSGFDIVSAGELLRVIKAKGDTQKVIFSGVGKSHEEIKFALENKIFCFNVESISELYEINTIAKKMNVIAPISIRINPDIDAKTHPYISTGLKDNKFGIAYSEALSIYKMASKLSNLKILGIDCHIGSQIIDDAPLLNALEKLIELVDKLEKINIFLEHIDIGGGIGIRYSNENPLSINNYLSKLCSMIDCWKTSNLVNKQIKLVLEPGRSIVGNSGILLTKVLYIKSGNNKNFAIVDAAMNDLLRPSIYNAWHNIEAVTIRKNNKKIYDIVGPVCETGDWLGKDRAISIKQGDFLAIMSVGAYGMSMASNYNSRTRAAELLVSDEKYHLIRKRESLEDLFKSEIIPIKNEF